MPLTFQRASTATIGTRPTSTQCNHLAKAFNDRILSGVADGAWRIVWYLLGLVRSPLNGKIISEDPVIVQHHRVDEWMKTYGLIDPVKNPGVEWPPADPGEDEGINLSSPLGSFVFGNVHPGDPIAENDLLSEDGRTTGLLDNLAATAADFWQLGKLQRGAYDPNTGAQDPPAFRASQEHYKIAYPYIALYLKAYGGFFPTPLLLGDCGDGVGAIAPTPLYEILFSPIAGNTQPTRYYSGFCPSALAQGVITPPANHPAIFGVYAGRFNYKVYRYDLAGQFPLADGAGSVDVLSTSEWVEGPYTGGGQLRRQGSEQLEEAMNDFLVRYRGSEAQRAAPGYRVSKVGFDYENFMKRQYLLAPSYGVEQPGDPPPVQSVYPQFSLTGATALNHAAGTLIKRTATTETTYAVHTNDDPQKRFVIAGMYGQGDGLTAKVTIELLANGIQHSVMILEPDANKQAEQVQYFEAPVTAGEISFRLVTPVTFENTSSFIVIEVAELFDYKPWLNDAYLVLRMGSSSGGDGFGQTSGLDNAGTEFPDAKRISDDYFRTGCILNPATTGLPNQTDIGHNPVYESARRLVIDNCRLLVRQNGPPDAPTPGLVGYEVEGGKSVLHFARFEKFDGNDLDIFAGIAAPLEAITKILPSLKYVVKGGVEIKYHDVVYAANAEFTGLDGFEAVETTVNSTGAEKVYQVEGIVASPPVRGETNRWCAFMTFNVYHPSESSNWYPGIYGDNFLTLHQRCHLMSPEIGGLGASGKPTLRQHFSLGQRPTLLSEAPPGYIYAMNSHRPPGQSPDADPTKIKNYKACQIYTAPYEIESATTYEEGGVKYVKLKFNTRFTRCAEAPVTVAKDVGTWSRDSLVEQPYRTDENGIMEYLYYQANQTTYQCGGKIGDVAPASSVFTQFTPLDQDPYGGCFPRVWLTRLVPEVYEDDNDTPQAAVDRRMTVDAFMQMEVYLRAMCEGYIDSLTSKLLDCTDDLSRAYDFTFSNLMFQAIGSEEDRRKWISFLPKLLRGDLPKGHSMLPATKLYAEVFNSYVNAVNLLDTARIELPLRLEAKVDNYINNIIVTPSVSRGDIPRDCTPGPTDDVELSNNDYAVITMAAGGGGVLTGSSAYGELTDGSFTVSNQATFHIKTIGGRKAYYCSGGTLHWAVQSESSVITFRPVVDQLELNAIPASIRELLNSGNVGLFGRLTTRTVKWDTGKNGGAPITCMDNGNMADGMDIRPSITGGDDEHSESHCVVLGAGGGYSAPALPSSLLFVWRCAETEDDYNVVLSEVNFSSWGNGGNLYVQVPLVE